MADEAGLRESLKDGLVLKSSEKLKGGTCVYQGGIGIHTTMGIIPKQLAEKPKVIPKAISLDNLLTNLFHAANLLLTRVSGLLSFETWMKKQRDPIISPSLKSRPESPRATLDDKLYVEGI